MPFFIIFIILPLIEVLLFITVGQSIGLGTTLLLALGTAIAGGAIVQYQGLNMLKHIQDALHVGRIPLNELFDGICLIIAGGLLITPGFLTDTIGFILLIPFMRNVIRQLIRKHTQWGSDVNDPPHSRGSGGSPEIIEGEYVRMDDKP
jgi:UPF0716 protein FxsA